MHLRLRDLVLGWMIVGLGVNAVSDEKNHREAETAARELLVTFMTAWNEADDVALRKAMHFPFVTFGGGAGVNIDETADEFSQGFEGMREGEGWHSSSFDYDTVKVYLTGKDKVHLSVGYNRFKENGETYATGTVFYVATKIDGRWGVQLRTGIGELAEGSERGKLIAESRAAALGYMEDFNAADAKASAEHLNYPHLFMVGGRVAPAKDRDSRSALPDFERMRENEGWHFSSFDALEPVVVTENSVHWNVIFSRWHADGTRFWTVPALWITTKVDGEWGIQLRSLMPATYPID